MAKSEPTRNLGAIPRYNGFVAGRDNTSEEAWKRNRGRSSIGGRQGLNLQSLELRGFKSYGPQTEKVDFTNVDAVGIGGRNGAGKSSLIDALTFALYGKATATEIRELGDEALVNDRADEAYVSVTFEKDGTTYTVERVIKRKGVGKARLTSKTQTTPIADAKAVNEKVRAILGMDYETFVSSTIIRQEEIDRLTAKTPAERKETLAKIFGLDEYESMREKAHEKAWETKSDIAKLEETKRTLQERISQHTIVSKRLEELESDLVQLQEKQSQLVFKKDELEREIDEIRQKKAEFESIHSEKKTLTEQLSIDEESSKKILNEIQKVESATRELAILMDRIKQREELNNELKRLIQESDELKVRAATYQQKMLFVKQKIGEESQNYQKIKDYSMPICPICKRSLDEPHRRELLKKYELILVDLRKEHDQTMKEARDVDRVLEDELAVAIKNMQEAVDEMVDVDRKLGELNAAIDRLPQLREDSELAKARLEHARDRISELEAKLHDLESAVKSFQLLDNQRRRLEEELSIIGENLGSRKANLDRTRNDLNEIERAKSRYKETVDQISEKARTRSAYEFLEKEAFHKDGIPTVLLMEIVPEVENEASKILRDLSNGRMDIGFRFGRKTKTGKVTEELIVEAIEQGRMHPVSRYSGGERMRINLALRLGVSEVVTRKSGFRGRIETLVIDEGFGPLDEEGRKATVEILQALRTRFKKILVISHIDDVREAFETRLTVTRSEGGYSHFSIC